MKPHFLTSVATYLRFSVPMVAGCHLATACSLPMRHYSSKCNVIKLLCKCHQFATTIWGKPRSSPDTRKEALTAFKGILIRMSDGLHFTNYTMCWRKRIPSCKRRDPITKAAAEITSHNRSNLEKVNTFGLVYTIKGITS